MSSPELDYPPGMPCPHRAVLIVTRSVDGTSTAIARERKNLSCCLTSPHHGSHHDAQYDEDWDDEGSEFTHILRHEDGGD